MGRGSKHITRKVLENMNKSELWYSKDVSNGMPGSWASIESSFPI